MTPDPYRTAWRRATVVLLAGALAAAIMLAVWPGVRILFAVSPALLAGLLALAVAAALVVGGWLRRADARRRAQLADDVARWSAVADQREQAARTEAEQRLLAERGRLLARLDHELKNPLQATTLALDALRLAEPGSAEAVAAARTITTQTGRLTDLLSGLRKVADLDHRTLDREDVDLADLLAQVRDTCAATDAGRQREWSLAVPQAPWPVSHISADPDLLFLACFNLVDNAVKYTKPGERIEIRLAEAEQGVVVEVADTGHGIPADEVAGVWDELSRASTARGIPGQGLGLPLVRSVAARHGGRVDLKSRVGTGTVVRMFLPG